MSRFGREFFFGHLSERELSGPADSLGDLAYLCGITNIPPASDDPTRAKQRNIELVQSIAQRAQEQLEKKLLAYRRASLSDRLSMQNDLLTLCDRVLSPRDDEMSEADRMAWELTLALIRNMQQYMSYLHTMETGGTLPFQASFNLGKTVLDQAQFSALNDYFAFPENDKTPEITLKVPYHTIPTAIWALFREAQLAHLNKTRSTHYKLEHDVAQFPPADLLYLPVQAFGELENTATDSVNIGGDTRVELVYKRGKALLGGGGQKEPGLALDAIRSKCLEERLEEMHANLYLNEEARRAYNRDISHNDFKKMLTGILDAPRFQSIPEIIAQLKNYVTRTDSQRLNASILEKLITELDDFKKHSPTKKLESQLDSLRATLQVTPFMQTAVATSILEEFDRGSIAIKVRQFCDARGHASRQTSYVFVNVLEGGALETIIQHHLDGDALALGDDLAGDGATAKVRKMDEFRFYSPLEYLARPNEIAYSHDLNVVFAVLAQRAAGLPDASDPLFKRVLLRDAAAAQKEFAGTHLAPHFKKELSRLEQQMNEFQTRLGQNLAATAAARRTVFAAAAGHS